MKQEAKNLVKKTAKIAGVTCVAAGAIAIMTSGAALTAIGSGFRYVKDSVEKILKETTEPEVVEAEHFEPVTAAEVTAAPAEEAASL